MSNGIAEWLTVQEVADRVNAIHPGTITPYAVKNAANRHLPHEDRYLTKKGRMWLIDPTWEKVVKWETKARKAAAQEAAKAARLQAQEELESVVEYLRSELRLEKLACAAKSDQLAETEEKLAEASKTIQRLSAKVAVMEARLRVAKSQSAYGSRVHKQGKPGRAHRGSSRKPSAGFPRYAN